MSRTRSSGSNPIVTGTRIITRKSTSSLVSSYNAEIYGTSKSITDEVIPKFHRRSAKGEVFNNPCTRSSFEAHFENVGYEHELINPTSVSTGYAIRDNFTDFIGFARGPLSSSIVAGYHVVSPTDITALTEDAKIRALASIKKPDANTLVNLGEARETLRLIRNPLDGIYRLTRTFVQKRMYAKTPKALANLHLTWSFGVRPLMSEVEGYMKALDRKSSDRRTARSSSTITGSSNGTSVLYTGSVLTTCSYNWSVTEKITVRGGFLYSNELETMNDRMGISIRELPSAAWELIPFSFVADWIFNLEDVISAYMALLDTKILAGWVTTIREVSLSEQALPGSFKVIPTWRVTLPCSDWRSGVLKTYTRVPVAANASFIRFGLRPNLGRVSILSSISLLIQKLVK